MTTDQRSNSPEASDAQSASELSPSTITSAPIPPPSSSPFRAAPHAGTRRGPFPATLLLVIAALVAVGGMAFAAGRVTAPVAAATTGGRAAFGNGFGNGARASGAPGPRGGFGSADLRGTVTAVNGDTLTVDLGNGRTIEVKTDASTTYHQRSTGSATDVTTGSAVIIQLKAGQAGLGFGGGQSGQSGQGTPTVQAQDITVGGQ